MEETRLAKAFKIGFNDVLSIMAGFEVVEELDEIEHSKEISGVMLLLGDKNKIASLSMSKRTAAMLVSYMTGIPYYELEEKELYDGAAELINLVAGRAKALLKDTGDYFQITPPFTIVGKDHWIESKDKMKKFCKIFSAGEMKICLEVLSIN